MATAEKFEELEVWQNARKLTNMVYDLSDEGQFARDFALRDQIRRAAVSVMSNVAEGFESQSDQNFARYLSLAKASSGEVRSQAYIALDRKYISSTQFNELHILASLCSKQLARLIGYLHGNSQPRKVREESDGYLVEPRTFDLETWDPE
jgi:four helix bundle protein